MTPIDQTPHSIRLMVVDDHTLFRRGLVALLASDERFEVVGEAGDAAQALQVVQACRPQVMLLDNHLPGARGVDALPSLLAALPGLRVLMLTMSEDEQDLATALKRGASGYLLKSADIDELGAAIVRALAGQSSVSEPMTTKLVAAFRSAGEGFAETTEQQPKAAGTATPDPAAGASAADAALESLSTRERQTLELIARGDSNKEIARALGIAEATVKIHVQHILRKLGLASRVQAASLLASLKPAGQQAAQLPRR
ncbi:MAG: response regulator transcription factor [Rubrivivax sp.]|nr:response regulator transcription factor [Rubrivivax sp.]